MRHFCQQHDHAREFGVTSHGIHKSAVRGHDLHSPVQREREVYAVVNGMPQIDCESVPIQQACSRCQHDRCASERSEALARDAL